MTDAIIEDKTCISSDFVDYAHYKSQALIGVLLGLYWVIFFWDIWTEGMSALGLNATIFSFLIIYLLGIRGRTNVFLDKRQWVWVLPAILIGLSSSLYENPFFELINLFLFPIILAWFYNYSRLSDASDQRFDRSTLKHLFIQSLYSVASHLRPAYQAYLSYGSSLLNLSPNVIAKISKGFLGLTVTMFIVVPLLSTADALFAERLIALAEWPLGIFSWSALYKSYVFVVIACTALAAILAWERPINVPEQSFNRKVDSVGSGIMLGGVLMLYGLFIITQLERLTVGDLPVDLQQTKTLVKTGFWQLVALSFLNTAFFIYLYKKTSGLVQLLLTGFSIASLLILVSAGHRMFLYVSFYGLSSEKFYASYAVIFCGVLLMYLVYASVTRMRADILKTVMLVFLWMYTGVSLLPVETIIARTNFSLNQHETWRDEIAWIDERSTDVFETMIEYVEEERVNKSHEHTASLYKSIVEQWAIERARVLYGKDWYEYSLSSLLTRHFLETNQESGFVNDIGLTARHRLGLTE